MKTTKITLLKFFLIILLFCVNIANAQNSKFKIELEITPKTAFIKYFGENTNYINNLAKPLILIDAGINAKYPVNNKIAAGSGLLYVIDGFTLKNDFSDFPDLESINYSTHIRYHHIEVPLFAEFSLRKLFLKTGFAYKRLFLLKNSIRYKSLPDSVMGFSKEEFIKYSNYTRNAKELKELNYKMDKIAFLLSFGKSYDISDKLYWSWALQFKTDLLEISNINNSAIKSYLYSAGINLKIGLK